MLRIIAILFLLTSESIVFAQSDFETLLTQARAKRMEKKLEESDQVLIEAFKLIEALPQEKRQRSMAAVRNIAGLNALDRSEHAKAIDQFKKSIIAYQKDGTESRESLMLVARNLFVATKTAGLVDDSISACQYWISLLESSDKLSYRVLADAIDELAAVQLEANKFVEGVESLERMAAIYRDNEGDNSVSVAKTLVTLGVVHQQNKQYVKADEYLSKSLEIQSNLHGNAPHDDVINGIYQLAINQQFLKKDKESLDQLKQVYQLLVKKIGPDAEETRNTLGKVIEVAKRLNLPDVIRDSESSLARLDKIKKWEAGLPQLTPNMTDEQTKTYEKQLDEAKGLASEFGEVSKPSFLLTLNRLLYFRSRKMIQEELVECNKLTDVARQFFGENHPEVAAAYILQAECENRKGMTDAAIEDYKKSLSTNEDSGFLVASTQLRGLLHLAQTYSAQKRHAEAIPNFEKYIALRKKEGIKDDAEFGSIHNQQGVCQTAVGQHDNAMKSFQESYALLTEFVPKDAPILKTVESNFEYAKGELNKQLAAQATAAETQSAQTPKTPAGSDGIATATQNQPVNADKRAESNSEPLYLIPVSLFLAFYVSMRAKEKGYGRLRWFWALLCSCTSPVLVPCVLAMLPDRRIAQRREKLFKALDLELASTAGTIGNRSKNTIATGLAESIGDQATQR